MATEPPGIDAPTADACCLRCGAGLTAGALVCPACGAPSPTGSEERGHIDYLLRALARAAREGLLAPHQAERIARPYRQRAGLPPQESQPARPVVVRPPRPPVNLTVVWANGLLYLGAFFVVITGLLFLLGLGGLGRTLVSVVVALGFVATGVGCRRFEIVRSAGTVFVGTGALLVPLIFVSLASYIEGTGPFAPRIIWLVASLACAVLYAVMAVLGLGRFYAVLTLIATSNAFLALHAAARWDDHWYPTLFGAQALVLCVAHETGGAWLRRHFGPLVRVWGWAWTLPALVGWGVVSVTSAPVAPLPPLVLLAAWAWFTQWRLPNPVLPAVAGALQLALVAQALRWLDAPAWSIGIALPLVAAAYVVAAHVERGRTGAGGTLLVGILAATIGPFPPLFDSGHWSGIVSGLLATSILVLAAVLARWSLVLVPAGWTLGVGWYFLLSLIEVPERSPDRLGVAYLPVVVLLAVATLAMRLEWTWWRYTLTGLLVTYAGGTVLLTLGNSGRLSASLAVATLAGAALAARWPSPWLLVAPCATATALALSFLLWLDAPRPSFGPAVLALGLAFWTAGLIVARGRALPLRLVGAAVAALAFVVGVAAEWSHTSPTTNWSAHLNSLTLAAIAAWISLEARARRAMLYPASLMLVAAGLWEQNSLGVNQVQAYAVPLGFYFVAVGFVAARDGDFSPDGGWLATAAWTLAGLAFCLPTFAQTFGDRPIPYATFLLAESFLLVVLGLVVGRRSLLATASTFVILAGLRMVVQNPNLILPALVSASCLFLSVGLGVLIFHGLKRRRAAEAASQADTTVTPP